MCTTYHPQQELQAAILNGARTKSNSQNDLVRNAYAAGLMSALLAELFLEHPDLAKKALPVFNIKSIN